MTTDATNWDGWTPTPENVNALPLPLRKYIRDLQSGVVSAGTITENVLVRDENAALRALIAELTAPREPDSIDLLDLPPLPEPCQLRNYSGNVPFCYYSHAQMHSYARAALAAGRQSQPAASALGAGNVYFHVTVTDGSWTGTFDEWRARYHGAQGRRP